MLFQCWATVCDTDPALKRHWAFGGAVVNTACLKSRRSRVRTPLWYSGFKINRLIKIQYFREENLLRMVSLMRWQCPPEDSKFVSWPSEAEHASSWSRRLPTILNRCDKWINKIRKASLTEINPWYAKGYMDLLVTSWTWGHYTVICHHNSRQEWWHRVSVKGQHPNPGIYSVTSP